MNQSTEANRSAQGGPPPGSYPYPFAYPYFGAPEEDEVTVLDLVRVLLRRWKLILLVTILGTGVAVAYALSAPPVYRAQAVIAPPEQDQPGTASAALAAFGGIGAEIAGSMGINLGGADATRLEALLRSHRVMERVVTRHGLLPLIFADLWDPAAKRWKVNDPKEVPTPWDAERELTGGMFTIDNDAKTGVLRLAAEHTDPEIAKTILQDFLRELALVVQEDRLKRIDINRSFVEAQLRRASDPVIVTKLQALLSDSIEKSIMAQNLDHLAYELVDPVAVPDRKVKPQRVLIGVFGLTASLILGGLCAFVREWFERARQPGCHRAETPDAEG